MVCPANQCESILIVRKYVMDHSSKLNRHLSKGLKDFRPKLIVRSISKGHLKRTRGTATNEYIIE